VSNNIWILRVVYCERWGGSADHWDDLIGKTAGRKPIGSGLMLETKERDLEYEFKTFPAASRAMQRISKLQWIKGIILHRQRTN
jgi:hypothetical protein